MQAAGLAARNGAPIHITAFGNTAVSIRRDTCRHRLGQENAAQQYQENDENFSHSGTVSQDTIQRGTINLCMERQLPIRADGIRQQGAR